MAPLPKTVRILDIYYQSVRNMNPQGMAPGSPTYGQIWPRGTKS